MEGFADWDENSVFLLAAALLLMAIWGCVAVAMDHLAGRSDSQPTSQRDSSGKRPVTS
jgi:hypothetical protein